MSDQDQNKHKSPAAIKDFGIDWSKWLGLGETILTSSWIVPVGLTLVSSSNTSTVATCWISGGRAGITYTLINRITTNVGTPARSEDASLYILVAQE